MSDVREWTDGTETVRIYGLDAKATSLATAQLELEMLLDDGVRAGRDALGRWRGRHAETFVADADELFRKLSSLALAVGEAKRTLQAWPDPTYADPFGDDAAQAGWLDEPPHRDHASGAEPDDLDVFVLWCQAVCERIPSLTSDVNLDGVTADVTRPVPIFSFPELVPDWGLPADPTPPLAPEPEPQIETFTTDPAVYVSVPDVGHRSGTIVTRAGELGPWASGVAVAFRLGDEQLLDFVLAHPELADELAAGFTDGVLGGESAAVILLAYFDEFDGALTGDTDGRVSLDDIRAMSCNGTVPGYVEQAAQRLLDSPQMFMLLETMNDGMDNASDIVGNNGDDIVTRQDIEAFVELNDHVAVLEQNFDAFDTAAHGGSGDGTVSVSDLQALAGGEGEIAAAAAWLLDHGDALTRVAYYDRAKDGFLGGVSGSPTVSATSLTLLAVDQQTYADDPNQAAAFVDRRFEPLMGERIGHLASPDGMQATFTSALTGSDQGAALLERVITEVADDGTIHNTGLPPAFAQATAAHMEVLDHRINAPFGHQSAEAARQGLVEAHDFFREVSRYPEAAERLRQAVNEYGMTQVGSATDTGGGRALELKYVGRVQEVLNIAQNNAMTDEALADLHEAIDGGGIGPTPGSLTEYGVSFIPYADTVDGIADALGFNSSDAVDWLLGPLDVRSEDAFDALSEAERVNHIRRAQGVIDRSIWLAVDLYHNDPSDPAAVAGRQFFDADGNVRTDMTAGEAQAFREWATDTVIGDDDIPGPRYHDEDDIGAGADEVFNGQQDLGLSG
jgi:hypothetical protein